MLANIAQITMDDKVTGEDERDSTRRSTALPPQPDRIEGHGAAKAQQHDHLRRSTPGAIGPVAIGAATPLVEDAAQTRIFTRLGSEGLDHRVASHGICQGAAYQCV